MQENVKFIEDLFTGKKVTVDGNTAKFNTHELDSAGLCKVHEIAKKAKSVNVKRSGTGLAIIFKF